MSQPRVLLVEDDDAVRAALTSLLRIEGVEVIAASGAGEALGLRESRCGAFDLTMSDVMMSGGTSGLALAEQIRKVSFIPVLLVSGHCNQSAEAFPMLQKPVTRNVLRRAVDALLGEPHRPQGPRVSTG